jgi:hypothetical protein
MAPTLDPELKERIDHLLDGLEAAVEDRSFLAGHPMMWEVRNEIGDLLEDWARERLGQVLRDPTNTQLIARSLAEIHSEVSGAKKVSVSSSTRSMVMEVKGCPKYRQCSTKSRLGWCFSDMIIATLIQRAMETPVVTEVRHSHGSCIHEHRPAWLIQLVSDLDRFGAEGMVMLYGDRVLFSHLPSEKHAEVLSEGLLLNEESDEGSLPVNDIYCQNRKIMVMRFGKVFISVCLRPEGADERGIRGHIESALNKADLF